MLICGSTANITSENNYMYNKRNISHIRHCQVSIITFGLQSITTGSGSYTATMLTKAVYSTVGGNVWFEITHLDHFCHCVIAGISPLAGHMNIIILYDFSYNIKRMHRSHSGEYPS